MRHQGRSNFMVGLMVTAALVLFVIAVYLIGSRQNMFGETFIISAVFKNVNGLQTGNSVRYSGINVGTVDRIIILTDSTVEVKMKLNNEVKKFIKKDAFASIGSDGLVGNMLVNISPGSGEQPQVDHLDQITSFSRTDTDDILSTLSSTNENIAILSRDLLTMTRHINEGQGTITALLKDTTLSQSLKKSLHNLEVVSGNSILVLNKLDDFAKGLNNQQNLLHLVLKDTSTASELKDVVNQLGQSSRNLQAVSQDLQQASGQLNQGDGTLTTLLYDSAVSQQLKETISNINQSSILLNENMEAMRQNFLFKKYFKEQNKNKKE